MSHLAAQPEVTSTIPQIAEAAQVPPQYLRKVLSRLRAHGILVTQRGTGGGVRLAVDPAKLTILELLNAVDPIKRIERCPLGLPEHFKLCPLHAEIDAAIEQVEQVLARKTIGDLLAMKETDVGRCPFPENSQTELYQL